MKHRLGNCSACGAQYRVPESFRAERAKCKSCGGVVELGAAGAEPRPGPSLATEPRVEPSQARAEVAAAQAAALDEPREADPIRSAARAAAGRVRARRHAKVKPKGAGPLLVGILAAVVAVGISLWLLTLEPEAPTQAAGSEPGANQPAPAPAPPVQQVQVAPPAPRVPPERREIDLSRYPDEGKLPGTSDADWEQIRAWVKAFLDPSSGAFGKSARSELLERGREAFPALLNAMKGLELASDAGHRAGDMAQELLTQICRGQTHGWYSTTQAEDVRNNKLVIVSWIGSWREAKQSPEAWARLTQSTLEDAKELFEKTGPAPAAPSTPDSGPPGGG